MVRKAGSRSGVSQQASYFKAEATEQNEQASKWLKYTLISAGAVILFAILSMFLHKLDWVKPSTNAEMAQLISSKVLIFATLAYALFLCSRNYLTHKHNAVVNKHRQNALLTYRALVDSATDQSTHDIVLAHAASCIFSPQDTGFSNSKGDVPAGAKSVLELMTKSGSKSE